MAVNVHNEVKGHEEGKFGEWGPMHIAGKGSTRTLMSAHTHMQTHMHEGTRGK